jgi:NADH dehydrogenase/NADH:ubiquinone oxidoreductase 75 kD subunit (chain G)
MVKLTIDSVQFEAAEGTMVLDVANTHNIYIPTLCNHEAVSPYGACRLCTVEVSTKNGRKRLVTPCLYPVEDGMVVVTNSEKVSAHRRTLMKLLMARCPESEVVKKLAQKLGVESTPFPLEDHHNCILCALCTRVCAEVVGVSAISFVNRGVEREMGIPFFENTDACIACGSCAYVCPTAAIMMEDKGDTRLIHHPWNEMKFKMAKCKGCGHYWAPVKQIEYMAKRSGQPLEFFDKCPDCRS